MLHQVLHPVSCQLVVHYVTYECLTKIIFDITGIGTNTDILTGIGTPSKDSGSLGDTVNIRT